MRTDPATGREQCLVKFVGLDAAQSYWEFTEDLEGLAELAAAYRALGPIFQAPKPKSRGPAALQRSPAWLGRERLMPHQLEGVNWLMNQ